MDNRTIEEVRENETKLIDEIKQLEQENKKYKEVINKAIKWVRDYMDEWDVYDEVYHDLNDLLILLEEVEHE